MLENVSGSTKFYRVKLYRDFYNFSRCIGLSRVSGFVSDFSQKKPTRQQKKPMPTTRFSALGGSLFYLVNPDFRLYVLRLSTWGKITHACVPDQNEPPLIFFRKQQNKKHEKFDQAI